MMREFDNRAALLAGLAFMLFICRCIVVGHMGYRLRVSYYDRSVEAGAANLLLERRVAERTAELTRTNEELDKAGRHLQAHAYAMAHELRAPLRAIDGFSGLLANEYAGRPLDAEALDFIARTRQAGNRLAVLVDDLAQLAKVSRAIAQPQAIDLVALAIRIVEACGHRFPERSVAFLHPPSMMVMADPDLMQSALQVLIDNAWKFTAQTPAARVELGMQHRDGGVEVFVRDNGIGFDRAYADKLFGIFQRLHPGDEFEGSGIGLALLERIVGLHGGRVWAEGAPGAGATFYFTLATPAA
jgi:light-regulated signal transduction histidine kinase (bacteriophytochrome)